MNPRLMMDEVIWKRRVGITPTGDPIYAEPETIKVKFDQRLTTVRLATGENLMVKGTVRTIHPLQQQDVLVRRGVEHLVMTVIDMTKPSGKIAFRTVFV
jgi:hypothetical protein